MILWPFILIAATVALFILPLIPSIKELKRPTDTKPLRVIQDYNSDIRYFAQSFKKFLEKNLPDFFENDDLDYNVTGALPDNNKFLIVGKGRDITFDDEEKKNNSTAKLILAKSSLKLPAKTFYETEVYSAGSVDAGENSQFRAILAEGDITLASDCTTARWMHCNGSLQAGQGCKLFGRSSAEENITLSANSNFERLHAKKIIFGQLEEAKKISVNYVPLEQIPNVRNNSGKRWVIDGDLKMPEKSLFEGNLITTRNFYVGSSSHIKGSIKSNDFTYISDNTQIDGAVVSVGDLYIGANCQIGGPVISEGKIIICEGSVIGMKEMPTSVCALEIEVMEGVVTYGTIWAEEKARIIAKSGSVL